MPATEDSAGDSVGDSVDGAGPTSEPLVCSAKSCHNDAVVALRWNNPKIHPPQRRKTWLACPEHQASLTAFLSARGFMREAEPL